MVQEYVYEKLYLLLNFVLNDIKSYIFDKLFALCLLVNYQNAER